MQLLALIVHSSSGTDLVFNNYFKETILVCLQCAKGSDAFSGEPREGHSPE